MKVIATFDKSIAEVLSEKVKARMNFKVLVFAGIGRGAAWLTAVK